ncbi:hypothetical protein Athai_12290 [Actinocatenispora thailandica]|uniref:DUF2087 domain-containing protein n=1 Tax=Actinocatenispora thailandica TaxID=227318 RepID=A0A7R7HVL3_9ACTN|nr:DUF2087 domain-containing protein [Actinocatenispora thailandica]BCJ33726.1 hypothetical protein Athai_12290 [Actinocatenispora thailandica]
MREISTAAAMLAALGRTERLGILAAVGSGRAGTVTEAAAETGLPVRRVLKEAARLADCGLLRLDGQRLSADLGALATAADALDATLPTSRPLADDPVLARHFRHGRLIAVPEDLALRHRLADLAATLLPADTTLTEAEVNVALHELYDDHAALRRLLADFGRVTRDGSARYRVVPPADRPPLPV